MLKSATLPNIAAANRAITLMTSFGKTATSSSDPGMGNHERTVAEMFAADGCWKWTALPSNMG